MIVTIGFGVFLVIIILSFKKSLKTGSSIQYFVANRQTSTFALIATLVMTELNTSTLIGFASLGASYGSSAISLALVFLVGLLFYAISVAKKWKQFDGVTVTTFFARRYNSAIGYIAAVILLMAMLGFSANYVKSLTLIFAPLFPGASQWLISGGFCLLMLCLTLRGGIKSIIRLDVFSFILTLVIIPAWLYYAHAIPDATANIPTIKLPTSMLISLIIITMFTYILAPWYGQKIFTARTARVAFVSVVIAALLIACIYALAIEVASVISAKVNTLSSPQEAIPLLISSYLPPIWQGLSYTVLFFIAATTLAGLWNTMASILIAHRTQVVINTSLTQSIMITSIIAVISYVLANVFIDQIFQKMVLMNIPIAALAFSLLAGFYYEKANSLSSLVSMLTGFVGGVLCYIYFDEIDYLWYWAVYVIPMSFLVGFVVCKRR